MSLIATATANQPTTERPCTNCAEPALPGKSRCVAHAEYARADTKRRREERIRQNLCTTCGKRTVTTKQNNKKKQPPRQCTVCRTIARLPQKERRQARIDYRNSRIEASLCLYCDNPSGETELCDSHAAIETAEAMLREMSTQQYAINNNLCITCREPSVEGKHYCEKHIVEQRALRREKRLERIGEGICVSCPNKAVEGKTLCAEHAKREKKPLDESAIENRRKRARRKYHEDIDKNRCPRCQKSTKKLTTKYCQKCIKAIYKISKKRKAA